MSTQTLAMDLRRVLDAPRGHRFSRTPHRPGTRPGSHPTPGPVPEPLPPLVSLGRTPRERALLAQMPDTPGLRRRMERGDLPEWMLRSTASDSCWRQALDPDRVPEPIPSPAPDPEPARTPGEDTRPSRPLPVPHPRREQVPLPPLPRRSDRPRRPASHRKPRRRVGPLVAGYALAILTGAVSHHLLALLG